MKYAKLLPFIVFFLGLAASPTLASETKYETRLVNAIRTSENNPNYGVLSIPCVDDCREICLNSVRNNLFRYLEATGQMEDFLVLMQRRYAPIGASNDPNNLNRNWAKNVLKLYNKGEKK